MPLNLHQWTEGGVPFHWNATLAALHVNVSVHSANKPADEVHLVSTEDVQYKPLVRVWELHVLGEDQNLGPPRKIISSGSNQTINMTC